MTEEHREYMRKYRAEHRKEINERMRKYRAEHREEIKERMRKRYAEHREEYREYKRKYFAQDLNASGKTKNNIRRRSIRYLYAKHSKLDGYEIHHCFGYEDPKKFIYIPKQLHIQIHQLLRDHKIPADSDHWNAIRDIVNSCEQYTYISV